MTLCPIALTAGCKKCLAVQLCPLKSVIGDYEKPVEGEANEEGEKAQAGGKGHE
jgi:hypothetical protein